MEREEFFSGYCRRLDASRMVAVVTVDGEVEEVDCCYGSCPHEGQCLIAQQIAELTKK